MFVNEMDWRRQVDEIERLKAENKVLREIAQAMANDYDYSGEGAQAFCAFNKECGLRMMWTNHGHAERWVHVDDCPVTKARAVLHPEHE